MNISIEQPWILDYWPIISDVCKALGVFVVAWWTLHNYLEQKEKDRDQKRKELEQRQDETRRDQCSRGLKMIEELLESNDKDEEYYSWDAMKMLDYKSEKTITGRTDFGTDNRKIVYGIKTKFDDKTRVDDKIIKQALNAVENPVDEEKKDELLLNVRECFDELYFRMGQLEDAIQAGLVTFEDVKTPIDYYVSLMAEDAEVHGKYIKQYDYDKTLKYLGRFAAWANAIQNLK